MVFDVVRQFGCVCGHGQEVDDEEDAEGRCGPQGTVDQREQERHRDVARPSQLVTQTQTGMKDGVREGLTKQ